jgi:multidrug efflux pump
VLTAIGLLGVVFHTLETLYIGGRATVRGGLVFGAVVFALMLVMFASPREVPFVVIMEMMALPGIVIAAGLLGMMFNTRRYLILTDNRARLLNIALGTLVAIVMLFSISPTGTEFFPATDPNQINISMEAPLGTNLDESNRIAEGARVRIDALLNEHPDALGNIKNVSTSVGVGGGIFGGGRGNAERSRITLNMVDYGDRRESSTLTLARLRDQLKSVAGADLEVSQDHMGPPTGAAVSVEVRGEDFGRIQQIAREVRQMLTEAAATGAIPGLVDVTDDLNMGRPELQVRIDRERAARFGLNTSQIASLVRSAISGAEAGQFRDGENEYDIMVRLAPEHRANLESVRNLSILHEGQQIPISAVADFELGSGLGSITRLNLSRVATVEGSVAPGYNADQIRTQVQAMLVPYREALPAGYTIGYTGEGQDQQEAFGFLTTALLIGVLLIFLIMVAQFNSVSAPFIIMVAVGLSLIGVMLGLIITRTPFGLFTFIGVISLAGIVVNNNIVLVDYAMQLRQRGLSKRDAIVEAGATRLRPVLLTALTTILGLIPLTFGINIDFVGLLTNLDPDLQFGSQNTQFWGPMGTAIISGLTFATFLTLVIVPVMYSTFDSLGVRLAAFFAPDTPPEMALESAGDGLGVERGAVSVEP